MRLFRKRRKSTRYKELVPEDILLDAENLPDFNSNRLEGKLERPIPRSTYQGISFTLGALFIILFVQAAHLELVKGAGVCRPE